jgi:hypothetical protein
MGCRVTPDPDPGADAGQAAPGQNPALDTPPRSIREAGLARQPHGPNVNPQTGMFGGAERGGHTHARGGAGHARLLGQAEGGHTGLLVGCGRRVASLGGVSEVAGLSGALGYEDAPAARRAADLRPQNLAGKWLGGNCGKRGPGTPKMRHSCGSAGPAPAAVLGGARRARRAPNTRSPVRRARHPERAPSAGAVSPG